MSRQITTEKIDYVPFRDHEIDKVVPISEPQREIWVSCQLGGNESNLAYNQSLSVRMHGDLDVSFLRQALEDLVDRHEALRATFSSKGNFLFTYKQLPVGLTETVISELTLPEQEAAIQAYLHTEIYTPYDLSEGPLFRFGLHKLKDDEFHFTLNVHHIIADGWTMGLLLEDLSGLYSSYKRNEAFVKQPPLQITIYNETEYHFKNSARYLETEQYWLDMYQSSVPVTNLPTDRPRPITRTYNATRFDFPIDPDHVERIRSAGAASGATLVITLLSAFEIFVHRKTSQNDIVIGLPTAGQAISEGVGPAGHCVNLLPLRSVLNEELSFDQYLKERQNNFLNAFDHQRITFGEFVKKLSLKRDSSRIPLVPVMFNVDIGIEEDIHFHGLSHQLISNPRAYETFEIFLNINSHRGGLVLEWSYNTNLFDENTITQMAHDFFQLTDELITNPSKPVRDVIRSEQHHPSSILNRINDTAVAYDHQATVADLFETAARHWPSKTAVIHQHESISYATLNDRSNQFAHFLKTRGIGSNDLVGVALDRTPDLIYVLMGVMKTGAAYIPLDPGYPVDRIEFMLQDSSAKALITSARYKNCFSTDLEIIIEESESQTAAYPKSDAATERSSESLAYVLYTSGSTGKPKGVQISQRNLVNFLLAMQKEPGITPEDHLLAITTISFDIAGLELYLPIISGATLVLADTDEARDGRLLPVIIKEQQITIMQATPATWRMMLETGWEGNNSIRLLCGGEALTPDLAAGLLPRCGALWNMYGPTETTIWSTVKEIHTADDITIGHPIQNTQVYVLNEFLQPVPPMTAGELYIGGDGVASGYLNRPELTAERFIPNPFQTAYQTKMYRTGDLALYNDDGELICLGRTDHQVKIRGFRIELGEIENTLMKLPEIRQAVVTAHEMSPSDRQLVTYVIPQDTAVYKQHPERPDILFLSKEQTEAWKTYMAKELPDYMIPQLFIAISSFPLTPNNKIDRKALPPPLAIRKAAKTEQTDAADTATATEKLLTDIWLKNLNVGSIRPNDDFFELGGHSLTAVKVMLSLEQELGVKLPLSTLFENSTIGKLAALVEKETNEDTWKSLVKIKVTGNKSPLYLIHGGGLNVLNFRGLAKYMDADQPVYGMQALGLNGQPVHFSGMEEIAAMYLEEIVRNDPTGPYAIAGYSLGGLLAYEIASQLIADGKTVSFVGIIDTNATERAEKQAFLHRSTKKIIRQVRKLIFFSRQFVKMPQKIIHYQTVVLSRKIFRRNTDETEEVFAYDPHIVHSYDQVYKTYRMKPRPIKIDLFRVKERIYFLDDPVYLGWKQFAQKGVIIHEIPGDHRTFLNPPYDREFAQILQKELDKINKPR